MLYNLKPLVVILALAIAGFVLLRPLCLAVMTAETFERRRNVWFALTIVAFLSPAYWIYAGIAIFILVWAVRRDKNPLALFAIVAFAVPNSKFYIPGLFFNQLFDLNQYRLLALVVIVPAIIRWTEEKRADQPWMTVFDWSLLLFLGLQLALAFPYQSFTESARQAFLLVIDYFLIFYAFSRLASRARLLDALMGFCIAALLMALVGALEWAKGWLLYTGLSEVWGDPNVFAWSIRGDRLRAQASSGNTLSLGYHLAIALGLLLYLKTVVGHTARVWLVGAIMVVGLYATSSRGPWLTAFLAMTLFVLVRPGAIKKMLPVAVGAVIAVVVMYSTPLKESVLDRMPIIGNADQDTIEYRQQLADLSFSLISQNPFFGDPFAANRMESLRQGQGIIDIVNGYLFTLLFTGWVGLTLQLGCWLGSFLLAAKAWFRIRSRSPDLGALGASILACFAATLFFHATSGTGPTTYVLAGLLVSFATVCRRMSPSPSSAPVAASGIRAGSV